MPSASVHGARTLYRVSAALLPCRRLITSPDRRLNVDQIKHHPFFYGVDWAAIRNIEAPFIPRLRSITDTSYFPTDELEQVPDEPVGADTTGANKDLAFLGYVLVLLHVLHFSDIRPGLVYALQVHVQAVHDLLSRFLNMHASLLRFHYCSDLSHVVSHGVFGHLLWRCSIVLAITTQLYPLLLPHMGSHTAHHTFVQDVACS